MTCLAPVALSADNTAVRTRRIIWLFTLCALLIGTLAPEALATWQCEGRACGTSLWFCCCLSPAESQDSRCAGSLPAGRDGAGGCRTACNCVLTVRTPDPGRVSMAGSPPTVVLCDLGFPVVCYEVPAKIRMSARSFEGRGPPPLSLADAPTALRGPPCMTPSLIGT